MFYVSENPVLMEGCNVGLCDWEYIKSKFGPAAEECNLRFCTDPNSASLTSSFGVKFLSLIGLLFVTRNHFLL